AHGEIALWLTNEKFSDALVIDDVEGEIVDLLQKKMRGIVVHGAALVVTHSVEEHLEGCTVEDVLARMEFIADVDAVLLVDVEDRLPAPRKLGEGLFDQARWALRKGIEIGKGERAGEGDRNV